MSISAPVFDIQRFSLHDGPGIRTVVFFQGCALRCAWCQNPEAFLKSKDLNPGQTEPADSPKKKMHTTRIVQVHQLWEEITRDKVYYGKEGGITLSGGEATLRKSIVSEIASRAEKEQIHLVLETSGFFHFEELQNALRKISLIFYDLKLMDNTLHRQYTGRSNDLILENARRLVEQGYPVEFRIPVVPSVNDTAAQILLFAGFLHSVGRPGVHLLKYHTLYQAKLEWLGVSEKRPVFPQHSAEEFQEIISGFEQAGITVLNKNSRAP